MHDSEIPVFTTQRLILRGVSLDDVPAYERYFVDYEVIRYMTDAVPWPYPAGGVGEYLEKVVLPVQGKDRWMWAILLRDAPGDLIGLVDLWRDGKPEHRGFWLGREFWGRGIMTEATAPVTDFAFDVLGFRELIFANAVGNVGSRRVKEKSGARLLRTEPSSFVDPQFTEQEVWVLTPQDWARSKANQERP